MLMVSVSLETERILLKINLNSKNNAIFPDFLRH